MIKVVDPKSKGNYSKYGAGSAAKKTYPSMKGNNAMKGKYKGGNVCTSKYCD